jgi:hypothetical protein
MNAKKTVKVKSRAELITIIENTHGKIFSCSFHRRQDGSNGEKAGTRRDMVCRTGVSSYVKGTGKSKTSKTDTRVVWDIEAGKTGGFGYRNITLDTLFRVTFAGKTYIYPAGAKDGDL